MSASVPWNARILGLKALANPASGMHRALLNGRIHVS